jgi:hypothetical protein
MRKGNQDEDVIFAAHIGADVELAGFRAYSRQIRAGQYDAIILSRDDKGSCFRSIKHQVSNPVSNQVQAWWGGEGLPAVSD